MMPKPNIASEVNTASFHSCAIIIKTEGVAANSNTTILPQPMYLDKVLAIK
ncbi:hypothetical protein VEE61_09070 [Escherichia coli]|nr:hypothetical protein VEE61_09070 [Escherichia coli]